MSDPQTNTPSKSETAMDDTIVEIPHGLDGLERGSIRVCIVTGMFKLGLVNGRKLSSENRRCDSHVVTITRSSLGERSRSVDSGPG